MGNKLIFLTGMTIITIFLVLVLGNMLVFAESKNIDVSVKVVAPDDAVSSIAGNEIESSFNSGYLNENKINLGLFNKQEIELLSVKMSNWLLIPAIIGVAAIAAFIVFGLLHKMNGRKHAKRHVVRHYKRRR